MHTRPIRAGDAPAITALLAAREAADGREALSEHKAVRRGHSASLEVVAVEGEAVAGYGHAAPHGDGGNWQMELVPAPGGDEEGTAGGLLDGLLRRLPPGAAASLWVWREGDARAAEARGLSVERRLVQMGRPLSADPPPPAPGVEVRAFRPGVDEDAWLAANNAAFAGHPEQGGLDRTEMEVRTGQPWFDPADLLMAWSVDTGALLGSCWTKVHPDAVGEIYVVGVVPGARGGGLGRHLVEVGLHHLATARHCRTAMLYTDPDAAAFHLYEKLGFAVIFAKAVYR